jgi:hypothetical protein
MRPDDEEAVAIGGFERPYDAVARPALIDAMVFGDDEIFRAVVGLRFGDGNAIKQRQREDVIGMTAR